MPKTAAAILCFCALSAILPATLAAQSSDEPILVVDFRESCKAGYNYQMSSHAEYRLCTYWRGPMGGTPSDKLYKLRRSVKGLKPGEKLQFYPSIMSGSGSDNSGCSSVMVSIGDGRTQTTVRNKTKTKTFEDKSDGSLPPSAYPGAELLRLEDGAILAISGGAGVSDGDLGFYQGVTAASAVMTKEQRDNYLRFKLKETELDQWENLNRSQSGGAPGSGKGMSWEYSVNVTAKIPDIGQVAVEVEGYDDWEPKGNIDDETKPGNEIHVKAWVCKTGEPDKHLNETATFTFELVDVGREKGGCANWPTLESKAVNYPDLRILEDKNPTLEQINLHEEAKTRQRVKEVKLVLSSFDYGARGVLKVTAKDKDDKPMKVVYLNKMDIKQITIPKDEDRNRIADSWQEANGVAGLPEDWDQAEAPGQDVKGDGLSLYQKYRGFVVSTAGGKNHTRLKPREKAHFVIDPQGIFDVDRWWSAGNVRAYKVLETWTDKRLVDINRGFGGGNGKWATKIIEDTRIDMSASEKELAGLRQQWGLNQATGDKWTGTPKTTEVCIVFSGRIRYNLLWLKARMLQFLKSPANDAERAQADEWIQNYRLPKQTFIALLERKSDADLEKLVRPLVTWVALHEVGHSCGLAGHLKDPDHECDDCVSYRPECPMQNMSWEDKWSLVLFGKLGGQGRFCDAEPQHCWRHLSPKD